MSREHDPGPAEMLTLLTAISQGRVLRTSAGDWRFSSLRQAPGHATTKTRLAKNVVAILENGLATVNERGAWQLTEAGEATRAGLAEDRARRSVYRDREVAS